MAYVEPLLPDDTVSEDAFIAGAISAYADEVPGWEGVDGDPVVPVLSVGARLIHAARVLVREGGKAFFAAFGRSIIALPPAGEAYATLTADIEYDDTNGHTVPAGTTMTWTDPDSEQLLEFAVVSQVSVPPGMDTVTVDLRAVFPGAAYNGVPDGAPLVLTDILAGATAVTATSTADGGADGEDIDTYVDKLADELGTLRLAVTNEVDAVILARRVPGVHRAFALDGWNPVTNMVDTDITTLDVGIVFLDQAGQDVDSGTAATAIAYLSADARRTVGVQLKLGHPTYTDVAVVYAATSDPDFDPVAVKAAADQAVIDLLDPALFSGGRAEPPEWRGENKVRYLEVANAIGRVPGINLQTLTVNGGTVDVTLAGRAPLPSPFEPGGSTVVSTVVPA